MRFSIFTSTYNRSEKIDRLIENIRSQTCTSWELIVVDDGSKDNTVSVVNAWCHLDDRIKLISFDQNCGHPVALYNAKICQVVKGDLVIFMGSDDWFLNDDCLETIGKSIDVKGQEFWKYGFTWLHEHSLEEMPVTKKLSKTTFRSEEIIHDTYPDSDFLFVYRKKYWDAFDGYFDHPDKFFSSFYDVALNNQFLEQLYDIPVMIAGWNDDNVTKGKNAELYFRWSLVHRVYMLSEYGDRMGVNYLSYTMRSISRSAFLPYSSTDISFALGLKSLRLAFGFGSVALFSLVGALWPFKKQMVWVRKKIVERAKQRK